MAYVDDNSFKSGKAFKEAVKAGKKLLVYSPGLGGPYNNRTSVLIEGPHYPAPHKWYVTVSVDADGYVTGVK